MLISLVIIRASTFLLYVNHSMIPSNYSAPTNGQTAIAVPNCEELNQPGDGQRQSSDFPHSPDNSRSVDTTFFEIWLTIMAV